MAYRDLIELYKSGKLEDEQKERIENDIERQEAISEYLFSESEIPGFEELKNEYNDSKVAESEYLRSQEKEAVEFTKIIKLSIRKAFIKMGMVVGVVVLAFVMVVLSMSKVVDIFYYDPTKTVGEKEGSKTNQISMDLATYSEAFLPGHYRDRVDAKSNGNGKYDINILQNISSTGVFRDVSGKIEKGKMIIYDPNILIKPFANAFLPNALKLVDESERAKIGYIDARNSVQELDENNYYLAYVTLEEIKKYSKFVDWAQGAKINPNWCAISLKNSDGDYSDVAMGAMGFIFSSSCNELNYDKDAYPYLSLFDAFRSTGDDQDWVIPEDVMTTHVVSIYKYMAKQMSFNEMIGQDKSVEYYTNIANNVRNNGLNIYGFTILAQKSTLLEISKADGVAYIYTQPIALSRDVVLN